MGPEAAYPTALLIGYLLGSIPFGLVLTRLAGTAAFIAQLHADGTVLTYDPDDRTLRADALDAPPVIIGTDPVGTHARRNRERRTA